MKQLALAAMMLLTFLAVPPSLAARHKVPRYLNKESNVDMSTMSHVFLGWVDLEPDAWALFGFASKNEWTEIIASLNANFARSLEVTYLPGRIITAANDKAEEVPSGSDLYIKFSNAQIDYDNEHLILSIHFINPKTNGELATIPVRPYYGDGSDIKNYLRAALDEVGTKLQVEVTGQAPGKKKRQ